MTITIFKRILKTLFFLGNGGYVSSVYKVPEEEYVIDEYSTSYEVPQAGYNAPSSSYKAPTSTSYNGTSELCVSLSCFLRPGLL